MMATALIVFREVLEAALIVTIVLAATKGVARRGRHVVYGVGCGLAGALVIALFSGAIADFAEGIGQELLNAIILFSAVGLLGWHNVWMRRHGRELARQMSKMGREVAEGESPLHVLSIVVGLAVLREGAEVVLFLYGVAAGGMGSGSSMVAGGVLGIAMGVAVGALMYTGLVRISQRHLFAVTGALILLVAAGMAAQAAGFLAQAGLLPELVRTVWDTSGIVPEHGIFGQLLHVFTGYQDRPSGIEVLFYVATILIIGGLMRLAAPRPVLKAAAGLVLLCAVAGLPSPSRAATLKVYEPYVEQGAVELEMKGWYEGNNHGAEDAQTYKLSAGYGVTSFWFTEGVVELEKEGDEALKVASFEWENIFQLTPQGKYWADLGFIAELEVPQHGGEPEEFAFGPLITKQIGPTIHTANVIFEKQFGSNAADGVALVYAWESRWMVNQYFEPGIDAFGEFGEIGHFSPSSEQEHRVGPMFAGKVNVGNRGGYIKYVLGVLFGLTPSSPDTTLNWRIEYETRF